MKKIINKNGKGDPIDPLQGLRYKMQLLYCDSVQLQTVWMWVTVVVESPGEPAPPEGDGGWVVAGGAGLEPLPPLPPEPPEPPAELLGAGPAGEEPEGAGPTGEEPEGPAGPVGAGPLPPLPPEPPAELLGAGPDSAGPDGAGPTGEEPEGAGPEGPVGAGPVGAGPVGP